MHSPAVIPARTMQEVVQAKDMPQLDVGAAIACQRLLPEREKKLITLRFNQIIQINSCSINGNEYDSCVCDVCMQFECNP